MLKYDQKAINRASRNGLIAVCGLIKVGLTLEYTEDIVDIPSGINYIKILNWWKDSGLTFKYDKRSINLASYNGYIDVLDLVAKIETGNEI